MKHLTPETIEALVMGSGPTDSDETRRHLAQCESCSGRLQREAQLEMLLHAVAGSEQPVASRRPAGFSSRMSLQAAAALLVLVGSAFWLLHTRNASSPGVSNLQLSQSGTVSYEPRTAALGRDVESPRDFGKWAAPYQPGLERSATESLRTSDSL